MILPLYMVSKLQKVSIGQKLGMTLLFSVAFVTIVINILRTIKSIQHPGFGVSVFYVILEVNLSVLISCVPTYRALFGLKKRITSH